MVGKLTPDTIISASKVPALLGMSPYSSPNDILKEVVDIIHNDTRPAFWGGNEATRWGDRLEPVVLGEVLLFSIPPWRWRAHLTAQAWAQAK